jgi:hypothetical protein
MVMTVVVHCKKSPYDVYIGRGSPWGNPFKIGRDGTREEVIEKYKEYAINNVYIMSHLHLLKNKILGCWCKPAPCHGDFLAEMVNLL